ncbi:MAG: HNH endonuclease [Chromatiaceae bacterium]
MGSKHQNPKWIAFRSEIIELDGGACIRCGRSREVGAILQVHHKQYFKDRAPWDYEYKLCETLCKACHAAEHGFIPPRTGWDFVCEGDLGDLSGICELCGNKIRYVFHIQHPHWEPMVVGTVCCDNLTGTEIATNLRNRSERLVRFIKSKRWTERDGLYEIHQKGIDIKLRLQNGEYRISMNNTNGKYGYPSLKEAKGKVFEVIDSGEAEKYLKEVKGKIGPTTASTGRRR